MLRLRGKGMLRVGHTRRRRKASSQLTSAGVRQRRDPISFDANYFVQACKKRFETVLVFLCVSLTVGLVESSK